MPDAPRGFTDEVVELHPAGGGRWAWTYRVGDVALRSNKDYDDEAAARAGAAHAYPDVPVVGPGRAEPASSRRRAAPAPRELARAGLTAAALAALVYALRRRST